MFKVGDQSESAAAEGRKPRPILTPEAVMSKRSSQTRETLYCGIDVSARSLTVAIQGLGHPVDQRSFPNNRNGHSALIVWLRHRFGFLWKQGGVTL